jgi:integrase
MARPKKWPPTLHLHRSSGQAYVRINGRNVYLGRYDSPESREAYQRILAAGGAPAPKPTAGVTVAGVIARFLADAEATRDPRGREVEQFKLSLAPVLRLYGSRPADEFDADALEVVQRALASGSWLTDKERAVRAKRKQSCALSRNVVNRRVVRIRTAWRWAERKKLVPEGRWAALCALPGLPKGAKGVRCLPRRQASSRADVERVAAACVAPAGAMLLLQWLSGMRSCEVRLMRVGDVDRSDQECWWYRVPEEADKNSWRDGTPRVVPLGPDCQRLLGPLLAGEPAAYVFLNRLGAPYTTWAYAHAVANGSKKAGVKVTPYQGRHSFKARVTREHGLDCARAALGQKSLGTTNGYAAELDLELAKEAVRKPA